MHGIAYIKGAIFAFDILTFTKFGASDVEQMNLFRLTLLNYRSGGRFGGNGGQCLNRPAAGDLGII